MGCCMPDQSLTVHDLTGRELSTYHQQVEQRRKTPLLAWLFWLFLGALSGNRYYLGDTRRAIAMTLTLGGLGIWALVDAFAILGALSKKLGEVESAVLMELAEARERNEH